MNLLTLCIGTVFNWFGMIVLRFNAWGWLVGGFVVYSSYRFLLKPLLGGKSIGDDASSKNNSSKEESSEENG